MGVGNDTKLYADVSENNMLSREFELAWGEDCSKNKKIRAKVDSRIYGRWRLLVMGSWSYSCPSPDQF